MKYCDCGRSIFVVHGAKRTDRDLCRQCHDSLVQSIIAKHKLPKPKCLARFKLEDALKPLNDPWTPV